MNSSKIIIYPRGFIGFDTGLVATKPDQDDFNEMVRNIKFNRPARNETSPYNGNPEVDSIVKEYKTGVSFITSFEFREIILKTALKAFGTFSFYDWCLLQEKNPYLTSMHVRFLNDTFFVLSGKPRSINISTWQSLLSLKEAGPADKDVTLITNEYFGIGLQPTCTRNFRLSDNVTTWCCQEDGFEDLLISLNILFGSI